jgi:hypothetical protein
VGEREAHRDEVGEQAADERRGERADGSCGFAQWWECPGQGASCRLLAERSRVATQAVSIFIAMQCVAPALPLLHETSAVNPINFRSWPEASKEAGQATRRERPL